MLRSIAFGGGGTRGALHAGAYRAIRELNQTMDFPDGIYGCSIGCIMALAAAFRMTSEQVEDICYRRMFVSSYARPITLDDVQSLFEKRGLMTSDHYMENVALAFEEQGVDIRSMTMDDLPQKVYFVSSNMTTGRASLLTGKIPVLKALACSSCIPFLTIPQELNGNVYLDGAVYTRCVSQVVPPETVVVHISPVDYSITPWTGDLMDILSSMMRGTKEVYMAPNVMRLSHDNPIGFLEDVSAERKKAAMDEAYSQARAFLTKRLAQEV